MLAEGRTSTCRALENIAFRGAMQDFPDRAAAVLTTIQVSDGTIGGAFAQIAHPSLPPVVGCAWMYWVDATVGLKGFKPVPKPDPFALKPVP
jgi:hypothetical protein